VRQLQELLRQSQIAALSGGRLVSLEIDGIFEEELERAVQFFQCQVFLAQDGIVGLKTWKAVCQDRPVGLPVLSQGSQGPLVAEVQIRLAYLQDRYYQGAIDGEFGWLTTAAVRNFQQVNQLQSDGAIAEDTWVLMSRRPGSCQFE
jgi:peptidoglycan hydrolase-like protein with peptidoglycan-binding domain